MFGQWNYYTGRLSEYPEYIKTTSSLLKAIYVEEILTEKSLCSRKCLKTAVPDWLCVVPQGNKSFVRYKRFVALM